MPISGTPWVELTASDVTVGDVGVTSIAAGDNNIGNVDLASAIPAGFSTIGGVFQQGATTGGLTIHRTISAASTNATSVKGSNGRLYGLYLSNTNAAVRYVKFYNKATAPTVGTDTPVLTLAVPGNTAGAGAILATSLGAAFATGIALAITTGAADSDTGAVAANEVIVNALHS